MIHREFHTSLGMGRSPIHRSDSSIKMSIAEGKLILHVRGADKLWAFKSSLEIPLVHIAGVRAAREVARGWYHGIRMPGTSIPESSRRERSIRTASGSSGTCITRRKPS